MHKPTVNLLNMGPSLPMFDERYAAFHDLIDSCNRPTCIAIRKHPSNLNNIGLRQLGHTMLRSLARATFEHIVSVVLVLGRSTPFKILKSVVFRISVLMVRPWASRFRTDERQQNQPVNWKSCLFSVPAEANTQVTAPVLAEYSVMATGFQWTIQQACVVRYYASTIAHAVKSFVTGNWFPNFQRIARSIFRHADLSLLRVDVQAGDTARTVRQPVSFVAKLSKLFNPKPEVQNGPV